MKCRRCLASVIVLLLIVQFSTVLLASDTTRVPRASLVLNGIYGAENAISSLVFRSPKTRKIDLSILVAYSPSLTELARNLFHREVTPIVLSVSSLPDREAVFSPENLIFEQSGRVWRPRKDSLQSQFFPLEKGIPFGGKLSSNDLHQGVVLLPSEFDVTRPIEVWYGQNMKNVNLVNVD